jgi:hypothetical protein
MMSTCSILELGRYLYLWTDSPTDIISPVVSVSALPSCWSVLLVEETTDLSQVTDKLYHIMLYRVHLTMNGVGL